MDRRTTYLFSTIVDDGYNGSTALVHVLADPAGGFIIATADGWWRSPDLAGFERSKAP